ncbi:MAG: acetyl-CoA carboxylase biotin carboxyl carrier protein [Myxococcota bacterium]|nr:acetyl-CoA carboxylase biotin carboxyl carrier protein [Myxococcota bacterium]
MDTEKIETLLKLMKEYSVATLEVESEGSRVNISLVGPAVAAAPMLAAAPVAALPGQAAAPQVEGTIIKSPMVGTFYTSAKPGEPPLVTVGSRISEGQALCIIEAMKLFNELESEISGVVAEVLVENAQPVQFGQPLFRIVSG